MLPSLARSHRLPWEIHFGADGNRKEGREEKQRLKESLKEKNEKGRPNNGRWFGWGWSDLKLHEFGTSSFISCFVWRSDVPVHNCSNERNTNVKNSNNVDVFIEHFMMPKIGKSGKPWNKMNCETKRYEIRVCVCGRRSLMNFGCYWSRLKAYLKWRSCE